jgi:predicted metal-dependent phosphoesterase TrpH
VIDLHLHTTASDGLLSPESLVERIVRAGIHTFSVTDHDTVAGLRLASAAAVRHGLRFLPGIEITAIEDGRDIHVLGYGFDADSARLAEFLRAQRADRLARTRRIIARLAELGMPLDPDEVIGASPPDGRAVGRPQVARALVAKRYADSVTQAFDRWLGHAKPAFVPRTGVAAAAVVDLIGEAGGVASLAHPGVTQSDSLIPRLASRGLVALEVWHSDHDPETTMRYLALAEALGLEMTGGSDFHGDLPDRNAHLGVAGMPQAAFDRFAACLRTAGAHVVTDGANLP